MQWFQHKGRPLREGKSLGAAGVRQGSLLTAHLRVRGGGGDGGATGAESRSSYLEMYMSKKPDKVCALPSFMLCTYLADSLTGAKKLCSISLSRPFANLGLP